MFYDSEVRAFDNSCDKVEISPTELAMSKMLFEQFTQKKFDKSKYSDKYIERITKAVELKLQDRDAVIGPMKGKTISTSTEDNLRKSLEALGISSEKIDQMVIEAGGSVEQKTVEPKPEVKTKAKPKSKRSTKAKTKSA
jgi:non-homologous end joining protein Ku